MIRPPTPAWEARIQDQLSRGLLKDAARTASEWRRAEPSSAKAEHAAGDIAIRRGDFEFALKRYQAAVSLDPLAWTSWANLSNAARYLQAWELYLPAVKTALEHCDVPEKRVQLHSNLLVHLHSIPQYGPAEIREEIEAWTRAWGTVSTRRQIKARNIPPSTPLKVAFVSGHFHGSILSATLPNVVHAIDPTRIELALVDTRSPESSREIPAWVSKLSHHSAPSRASIEALNGRFDIWVDLDGHAPTGTLHWQREKIAPIQVSWLDWFNTTGLHHVDYWLGDHYSNPPELDGYFTERIWRLPHFRLPYRAHPELSEINLGNSEVGEEVRFGAFGRIDKHNTALLDAWATILKALPRATLTLKASVFEGQEFRRRYLSYFIERGVREGQLQFRGNDSYRAHLAAYADIDVVLDSFPYNGGVSTFDALSMGRPVLSIWGALPVARQSCGLMESVGFSAFCRSGVSDYIDAAINIGREPTTWVPPPSLLRERFLATPMAQPDQFAKSLTEALEAMWKQAS